MEPQLLNLEDLTDRPTFETMLGWVGGRDLESHRETSRIARVALEAELTPDQREIYAVFSDAVTDAATVRESAACRVALAHGIAIGAALGSYGEEDAEAMTVLGTRIASALLGSGLPLEVVHAAARTTLEALTRAERVAALLQAERARTPGGHPIPKRGQRGGGSVGH